MRLRKKWITSAEYGGESCLSVQLCGPKALRLHSREIRSVDEMTTAYRAYLSDSCGHQKRV